MTTGNGTLSPSAARLKQQIIEADDRAFEDIEVPEWGGIKVRILEPMGHIREIFEKRISLTAGKPEKIGAELGELRVWLVSQCLVDPDTNERLFQDHEKKELNTRAGSVLHNLFRVALKISKVTEEEVTAAVGESGAILGAASS